MALPDVDINAHLQDIGLVRPKLKGYVGAHYPMVGTTGSVVLEDTGGKDLDGQIHGNPSVVEVRESNSLTGTM